MKVILDSPIPRFSNFKPYQCHIYSHLPWFSNVGAYSMYKPFLNKVNLFFEKKILNLGAWW